MSSFYKNLFLNKVEFGDLGHEVRYIPYGLRADAILYSQVYSYFNCFYNIHLSPLSTNIKGHRNYLY